jgi:acetyl esterase
MPVHPQVKVVLDLIDKAEGPATWELPPAEARAQYEAKAPILDAKPVGVFDISDHAIPGPAGDIPVRVYTPVQSDVALPVVVWIHGGGHVIGSITSYDSICRHLCKGTGAIVISVEYRLAPEHKFPAAVEDSFAVCQWVSKNGAELNGDPARLGVAGDSAGGNLAAVSALLARNEGIRLAAQALIYPVTAPDAEAQSHHDNADGYLLTRKHVLWFQSHYRRCETDREDFRYAPLIAPSHADLAPALIQVAQYDPLRDEGIAYAQKLMDAGNNVTLTHYAGMVHAFFALSGAVDAGRAAMAEVCSFFNKHL